MDLLEDRELQNIKEQLDNQHRFEWASPLFTQRDTDRLRIIKRVAGSYKLTCAQLIELVKIQRFGSASVDTAVLCYSTLVDPDHFNEVIEMYTKYVLR